MKTATHKIFFVFAFALLLTACAPAKTPHPLVTSTAPPLLPDDEPPPLGAQLEFSTDFSIHNVPYSDILSGGPPKDGIPPLDSPQFVSVSEADSWLEAVEPVILIEVNGDARAYPIQILIWHEITNDIVGGLPLTITFCPLCNTAIAFKRAINGQVLDFGTTGRLRYSNLIMYDGPVFLLHHLSTRKQDEISQIVSHNKSSRRVVGRSGYSSLCRRNLCARHSWL